MGNKDVTKGTQTVRTSVRLIRLTVFDHSLNKLHRVYSKLILMKVTLSCNFLLRVDFITEVNTNVSWSNFFF